MLEEAGELFIVKVSPSKIAVGTSGLSFIFIFKLSRNVNTYSKFSLTPAFTFNSKELF